MTDLPSVAEIRSRLDEMVEPLREQDQLVTDELQQYESKVAELRTLRTEIRRAIRAITGEPATRLDGQPRANGKPKPKGKGGGSGKVPPESLDRIVDWLREHEGDYPDGFTGTALAATEGFPFSSQTRVALALRQLHASERIVLDHLGGPGTRGGAGKFYRLTPEPGA